MGKMKTADECKESISKQLEMNKITFARLMEIGLIIGSDLDLDFSYVGPNEVQGVNLVDSLKQKGGCKIEAGYSDGDYIVQGSIRIFNISPEVIDQWVMEMCDIGQQNGCLFDGWGASV